MQIRNFTEIELDYFRKWCNFTKDEMEYLNLKAKGNSNIQISLAMNVSESQVSKLARRVKNKIIRVI